MRHGRALPFLVLMATAAAATAQVRHELHSGWEIQSSCKLAGKTGAEISSARFQPRGWIRTSVPSTVVAAQLANKLVPDPQYGMALRSLAGETYPIGKNFSNLPMPDDSPYRCSWWYRTEFTLPAAFHGRNVALHFDGINYRANIWLNGKQVANSNDVAGTWQLFEFDVTQVLGAGENVLAAEVFAPTENDLALTWVDWAPAPPDKDMGVWRPVYLTANGEVSIAHLYVRAEVDPDLAAAHLTLEAEVTNNTGHAITGDLVGSFAPEGKPAVAHKNGSPLSLRQPISLAAHEQRVILFEPRQFPELNVDNPRVWWPAEMGDSPLYEATLEFASTASSAAGAARAAQARTTFGIRQVTSDLINGQRQFYINGRPLLIRGGGWAPDLLLREDHKRLEDEFRMTRDLGLNTIRLEGKLESDDFFDLADRYGILVMAGWCCCDMWEKWDKWTDETWKIATASLADQLRRLRRHPSVFVWLNGSDNPPSSTVEQQYLEVLKKYDWPNPVVSSATDRVTEVSGPSGVKMNGPYDYVPPNYWLEDAQRGGAFGFATEISPGAAIPTMESLERFVPREHLWPAKDDEVWKFHSGGGQFANINLFANALDQRYGPSTSLRDFVRKSQAAAYEGERAMFEGYTQNKLTDQQARARAGGSSAQDQGTADSTKPRPATGVIQWMLNNAWPSVIWHLYDFYLVPGGGYYGTKEATRPLHVQYNYADHGVYVVTSASVPAGEASVRAELYNLDGQVQQQFEKTVHVEPNSVADAGIKPDLAGAALSKTFFLRLQLRDAQGKLVDENTYWLSTQPDVLDQAHGTWYYTPQSEYADLTGLGSLPNVKLVAAASAERQATEDGVRIRLQNPSKNVAFMVRLRIARGADGAPVFWSDNYVCLFPGEVRTIEGSFAAGESGGVEPVVELDGWNVAPESLRIASSKP